jgi:hypothetical protein
VRLRPVVVSVGLIALLAPLCADVPFTVPRYVVPADNAWDYYVAAFKLLPKGSEVWNRVERAEGEPSVGDVEQLVREARPALGKLREGLGKPCVRPRPETGDPSKSLDLAPNARAREMTRLLRWEGWLHAEHGDYRAAFRSYLDAITLGQDLARQRLLIDKLTSIACEAIACSAIRQTVAQAAGDEPALAEVVAGLQRVEPREVPYWETLAGEYAYAVAWLKWISSPGAITREEFRQEFGTRAIGAALVLARRNVDQYYSDAVAMAERDTWEWDPDAVVPPPDDSLAGLLASPPMAEHNMRRHLATLRGTLLVAALELHRTRSGEYPASLADLVPGVLPSVPVDPWTGQPFRYERISATQYKLYSVGPDRTDDGGVGIGMGRGTTDLYDLPFAAGK